MKRLLIILITLLPLLSFASNTIVTATITGTDGQVWSNGTFIVTFWPTPNIPLSAFNVSGASFPQGPFTGSMDNTGTFTITLTDNQTILPRGSKWQFTYCPNASTQCVTAVFAVTGGAMDLSTQLSALTSPLVVDATPTARAYLDTQVRAPAGIGSQYYDVINNVPKYWNGTIWSSAGGGGSGIFDICNYGSGNDIGARLNAADAALSGKPAVFALNKTCATNFATTANISSGHGIYVPPGLGNITSSISSTSTGHIKLANNTFVLCYPGWSSVFLQSSVNGARGSIIQANTAANATTSNVTVQYCAFTNSAGTPLGGGEQIIELGNCFRCVVNSNYFLNTKSYEIGVGGSSGSTFGQDIWVTDNIFIGSYGQAVAVINAKNVHVNRNIFDVIGLATIGSVIDVESNSNTDVLSDVEIIGNIMDYTNSPTQYGVPIAITSHNPTNGPYLVAFNIIIGGATFGATHVSQPIAINSTGTTTKDVTVIGNYVKYSTQAGITLTNVINSDVTGNRVVCAGGGSGYIRFEGASSNNTVHGNSYDNSPCGGSTGWVQEDAGGNNNTFWDNLSIAAVKSGANTIEVSRIDPTLGKFVQNGEWNTFVSQALTAGAATATLNGTYSAATSYSCTCNDVTNTANACTVKNSTTTQVLLTGTGTDTIRVSCRGN